VISKEFNVKRHAPPRSSEAGFTLIEIMVVIVILAVLATLVAPKILGRTDDAKVTKAKVDIQSLNGALDMYRLDNGFYPGTDQGLEALVSQPSGEPAPKKWRQGGYVNKLPNDPWGNPYLYLSPGTHGSVDIWSQGADGAPGGDGLDADIGSWNLDN